MLLRSLTITDDAADMWMIIHVDIYLKAFKMPLFLQCLQGKHGVVMIQDQEA